MSSSTSEETEEESGEKEWKHNFGAAYWSWRNTVGNQSGQTQVLAIALVSYPAPLRYPFYPNSAEKEDVTGKNNKSECAIGGDAVQGEARRDQTAILNSPATRRTLVDNLSMTRTAL